MKKNRKTITFLKQKSYLLAAVLMLAAVFGMTGVYVSQQRNEKKQELAEQQAEWERQQELAAAEAQNEQDSTAVDQLIPPENTDFLDDPAVISTQNEEIPAEEVPAGDAAEPEVTEPQEEPENSAQETAVTKPQPKLSFAAEEEMGWPLQGNVIMNYSMEQTVYFATLDQYKYNPALVIQGKVNDKVVSVADGKVSNIETNEVTGRTVTVELGDGYSAIYGQLKEVPLKAGDYIEAGDIVGYVSEPTKYYSVEGANLYFEMVKDNESIDPMEFLQ